jgi:hypothetical protein
MAAEHYRSAQLVFGWSFYRQGTGGGTASADEFLDAALTWFGDPDPRLGTAWEKGERLAKLVTHRRTLLILDGLEPLQNPPGAQEGRVFSFGSSVRRNHGDERIRSVEKVLGGRRVFG